MSGGVQVFRFKFDEQIVGLLYHFAKLNQHVDRKTYKELWESWVKENQEQIEREETRLKELGYEGDVLVKMYKSARYYFRTKKVAKQQPKERRQYVAANMDIIVLMDEHIKSNITVPNYRPASGYEEFCRNNIEVIQNAVQEFMDGGLTDAGEIQAKLKKTYKNRYFQFIKNQA